MEPRVLHPKFVRQANTKTCSKQNNTIKMALTEYDQHEQNMVQTRAQQDPIGNIGIPDTADAAGQANVQVRELKG